MTDILENAFLINAFSRTTVALVEKIPLVFVSNGPIDTQSALVYVKAWHRTDNKPSPERVLKKIVGAICGH